MTAAESYLHTCFVLSGSDACGIDAGRNTAGEAGMLMAKNIKYDVIPFCLYRITGLRRSFQKFSIFQFFVVVICLQTRRPSVRLQPGGDGNTHARADEWETESARGRKRRKNH